MVDIPRRALSIRQPWAWAILNADKDIENRSWSTSYRGPVAIHASKGLTASEFSEFIATAHEISTVRPFPSGLTVPPIADFSRGGIVGVVDIVDCVRRSGSPWFFGPWGFVLENARPVEFIPVRGALGFFDWRKRVIGGGQ